MEARQFDRWTRLFDGASRRDAIRLLATGMTGGLLANGGIRAAMAQVGVEKCKKKGDKCEDNNNNNCKKKGDKCKNNSDCCNNLKCGNNDKCEDNNNNNCKKKGDK